MSIVLTAVVLPLLGLVEGQEVAWTAVVTTVVVTGIGAIGTYLANKLKNRTDEDVRKNDDKWKIIGTQQVELDKVKKEKDDERKAADERYDKLSREHATLQAEKARYEERVGFLEDWCETNGLRVPRRRPDASGDTSANHTPLPQHQPKQEGGAK